MRVILFILAMLGSLWAVATWAGGETTGEVDTFSGLTTDRSRAHIFSLAHDVAFDDERRPHDYGESRCSGNFERTFVEPSEPIAISSVKQWMAAARSETEPLPDVHAAADPMEREDGKRWSSFLPLMAEEVEKRGIELPLPFGVSFYTVLLRRDVEVKEVAGAINGTPQDLTNFIGIDTSNSVSSVALRLDAWLLPFLNLYVLGGYVQNSPNLSLTLTVPTLVPPGTREVTINTTGELDGSILGGGITLVGGYKDFFLSLDTNLTYADLGGNFDEEIDVMLYSLRTGWRGQVGNAMMNIYVGGMYWDAEREISGSLPLSGGDTLFFRVLQEPVESFNFNFGMNVEISRQFQLVTEYGSNFSDMDMLTLSFAYRF
jgi:hypothetical protein